MSGLTVAEQSFSIAGPVGGLEVLSMAPRVMVPGSMAGGAPSEETLATPRALAVICHPHPLMGGTMHNKVVHTLARAHRDAGDLAIRFNFRGVGASSGRHDEGRGECEDLLCVVRWALFGNPGLPWYLGGFSFGSWVAARTVQALVDEGCAPRGLLLVAPPVHHFGFDALTAFPVPVTIIMGDADEVVPPADVFDWAGRITTPCTLLRMAGAGHFFHGRLAELKTLVASCIE
jgi:alpha/beta superfamily hydrolase